MFVLHKLYMLGYTFWNDIWSSWVFVLPQDPNLSLGSSELVTNCPTWSCPWSIQVLWSCYEWSTECVCPCRTPGRPWVGWRWSSLTHCRRCTASTGLWGDQRPQWQFTRTSPVNVTSTPPSSTTSSMWVTVSPCHCHHVTVSPCHHSSRQYGFCSHTSNTF